jgi:hypothetical protein
MTNQHRIIEIKAFLKVKQTAFLNCSIGTLMSKTRNIVSEIALFMKIPCEESTVEEIAWNVVTQLQLSSDIGVSVVSDAVKEDMWLNQSEIKFQYFNRFITFLNIRKNWLDTKALEQDSLSIIQMLGNPKSPESTHRRGLIVGDVQSGKTASYTAIMNRAIDVGYNVIVLLSGSLENLRRQTQERIDNELVGFTIDKKSKGKAIIATGVGCYPINQHVQAQTNSLKDFNSLMLKKTQSKISDQVLLYVTKKNVTSLKTILSALINDNQDRLDLNGRIKASILVVDDEADNASINTKKNDDKPTRINAEIRSLLQAFTNTSYLAVTATPFANIFIDNENESEMFGDDLFPSDFIHLLDSPIAYIGARKLFSDSEENSVGSECKDCLIAVEKNEIPENSFQFGHNQEEVIIRSFEDFPASLKKSIRYFLLVQYLMDFCNIANPHRTMMINVSRFVKIQEDIVKAMINWHKEILVPNLYQWHNYPETASDSNAGEIYSLKLVWDEFKLAEMSGRSWEEVCPGLYDSINKIRICSENMSVEAKKRGRLNYQEYQEGDRVIVVGGQCLSRGLTLENLVVTYFYRNSAAYDTLLQMGRWFGYRTGYLDYFKIWMAEEAIAWYKLISDACEDLKLQIVKMNCFGMEPRRFGLMVRHHPCTGLIVTARCKMRSAVVSSKHPIDLAGRLIESPRLWKDAHPNNSNRDLIRSFLKSINNYYRAKPGDDIIIHDIPRECIGNLVSLFDSATLSLGFQISQLSDFIIDKTDEYWDVAINQTGIKEKSDEYFIGEKKELIYPIEREYSDDRLMQDDREFIRISRHHVRVGSGPITKLCLSSDQINEVASNYCAKFGNKKWNDVKGSSSVYLEAFKDGKKEYRNPLLILYPLDLWISLKDGETESYNLNNPITWALGLGFPGNKNKTGETYFEYFLNPVAIRSGIGIDNFGEDDEND